MPASSVKFHHLRSKAVSSGLGAVTVAYKEVRNGIAFGFAFCSPKDNFNKHTGCDIALSRLETLPVVVPMKGNRRETEKFVFRMFIARNFDRLAKRAKVPSGLPNIVPGWFKRWSQDMTDMGLLCVKAERPS